MFGKIVKFGSRMLHNSKLRALPAAKDHTGIPQRVLILGYGAIGDFIFFLPALQAIRGGLARARITFVMNRYPLTTEFLPASGLVDEIWEFDPWDEAADREVFHRRIKAGRFDAVVATYATPIAVFAEALLSIPVRVGHCYPLGLKQGMVAGEDERKIVFNRPVPGTLGENAVVGNLKLAKALGLFPPLVKDSRPRIPHPEDAEVFAKERLPPGKKWIGLHLGAPDTQYGKLWNPGLWGTLCRVLVQKYRVGIVLLGGKKDRENLESFTGKFTGEFVDLLGQGTLVESLAVLRRCDLFLAGDTGLAKSSIALGVPTVTLWGPTDPGELQPPWEEDKHLNISRNVECAPCVRLGMPKEGVLNYTDCGHRKCLTQLGPEEVLSAIEAKYARILDRLGSSLP